MSLTAAAEILPRTLHFCSVEEDMVDGFPYEVPEEYRNMPLLKGRATVDMKVKVKDNPNLQDCVFRIVLDGYNAPVTAGNFLDLVERHFYDGMEIQRGITLEGLRIFDFRFYYICASKHVFSLSNTNVSQQIADGFVFAPFRS